MQHKNALNQDFYRARFLLNNRFNTVEDLLRYLSYAGPCKENHPLIEKIKDSE
jgi:hypothetical protein